ncbi:MAG: hypothetical protein ABR524_03605 [Thermoanaerobaculia bacterium]
MRNAAAILLVLAVAMIVPVMSIAGACGPKPPCCKASASDETRITRESCCAPASCASSTVEAREGTTPSLIQRVEIQMVAIANVDTQAAAPEPLDRIDAHSAVPPSLNRRLATLSILII